MSLPILSLNMSVYHFKDERKQKNLSGCREGTANALPTSQELLIEVIHEPKIK